MKHVLDGLRVVELAGIGPSPHAAMQLADSAPRSCESSVRGV